MIKILSAISSLFLIFSYNAPGFVGPEPGANLVSTAEAYVNLARQGRTDELAKHLDPSMQTDAVREELQKWARTFPPSAPLSVDAVGQTDKPYEPGTALPSR